MKIVYDKNRLVPVSKLPTHLEFNATGYGWNFLRKSLRFNRKPVYIKPEELPKTRYITSEEVFPLFSDQLSDLKINYFLQDTLYFEFDRVSGKKIYLKLDTHSIALAPNYRLIGNMEVNPPFVYCSGPAKFIKLLPDSLSIELPTETIQGDFEEFIPITGIANPAITLSHKEVLVKFEARNVERMVKNIKIKKRSFPTNYKLNKDSIAFVFYIDPDNKEALAGDTISITADFSKKSGNKLIPTLEHLPEYIEDYEQPAQLVIRKINTH